MARRRKKQTKDLPEVLPPPERAQHGDIIEQVRASKGSRVGDVRPFRNVTQLPLDRYLYRKQIQQDQHDAGMRLYQEWRASGSEITIIASYSVRINAQQSMTELQAEMKQRVDRALDAVGPMGAPILVHVCIIGQPANEWCMGRGMRQDLAERYGIQLLRDSLWLLKSHYDKRFKSKNA